MSPSVPSVLLPTGASPSRIQEVLGKHSLLSPDVEEFRGIPYASIPGRWKHSIPRTELPSDIFDATRNGPKCPQPSEPNNSRTFQGHVDFPSDVTGSEFDCLNLFVQRPSKEALKRIGKENEELPVFVWIHGGGFGFGAGTDPMWDPGRLVLQSIALSTPIIVVSINYRVNIFGFLASPSLLSIQPPHKGINFGLEDQHIALRWICTNISHFGGDPAKVTIAGQSAGAASVHVQVLNAKWSEKKPMFRRAVLMSGSIGCLGPCGIDDEMAEGRWRILCDVLGIDANASVEEKFARLSEIETGKLNEMSWKNGWVVWEVVVDGVSVMATDVEGDLRVNFEGGEKDSGFGVKDGQAIEILVGETDNEGSLFASRALQTINSFSDRSKIFNKAYPIPAVASEIMALYNFMPETPLSALHTSFSHFVTEAMFSHGAAQAAAFLSKDSSEKGRKTPVKEYHIQYGNPLSGPSFGVAHHCVDLIYLFDCFHDDLAKADELESSSLNDKSEGPPYKAAKSNADLTLQMQKDWIEFITKDAVYKSDEEETIRVYGHDRVVREESLGAEQWVEKRKRMKALGKEWKYTKQVLRALGVA